ncbi:hypothetical protein VdG1_05737 [Verticillium dahliae VDG1]|nr:hypothetical protein VdG1_05737 [Verticillium dahliae VDG1]
MSHLLSIHLEQIALSCQGIESLPMERAKGQWGYEDEEDEEQDEDEDEDEDGGAHDGHVMTEEDLRAEEEEVRELERKKRELQARLRAMDKDLGGLLHM